MICRIYKFIKCLGEVVLLCFVNVFHDQDIFVVLFVDEKRLHIKIH